MKIAKIRVENFRGYKEETVLNVDDLTLIVGKNDVGKSTFLEAADVFFGKRKVDKDDLNINCKEGEKIRIHIEFTNYPPSLDIDSGAETNLKDEFLLNTGGNLHIVREYTPGSVTKKQFLVVSYPKSAHDHIINNKITDLKRIATESFGLKMGDDFNGSVSNSVRKAIWAKIVGSGAELVEETLEVNKEDGKKITEKLEEYMPIYTLFSADRKNTDQDDEVQKPIKAQIQVILKELDQQLEQIRLSVKKRVEEVTSGTQNKLAEMNAEIAKSLSTKMDSPAWDKAFSVNIETDGVPLNKRGSGVKRLVLINFFREEAERQRKARSSVDVFYAIEEPETSQHPDWQIKLFNAFIELSETGNTQIAFTTHHPELGGLVPVQNIRYIEVIKSKSIVNNNLNEDKLYEVADTLGVLPRLRGVKVVFCLEGPTDVEFFRGISVLFGIDPCDERILWLPLGGGNLKHFVVNGYLESMRDVAQVHYYDRDEDNKYEKHVDELRKQGKEASLSTLLTMENYIHPKYYKEAIPALDDFIDTGTNWLEDWADRNIPQDIVAELITLHKNDSSVRKLNSNSVKNKLCKLGEKMTIDDFNEMGTFNEIKAIFDKIKAKI